MANDKIVLKGMKFFTLVGLLPHEAEVPQPLEIDLTVWLSLEAVGRSDSPRELLDYRRLYDIVSETVGASPHKLLEALCEKLCARVLELPPVRRVEVAARKPHAPIQGPLDHVEVVVQRSRES
jgi:dihydroneopterin aldolase